MYEKGLGVSRDDVAAYLWLSLAADQGVADAVALRDKLGKTMNPLEVTRAQTLVKEWKPEKVGSSNDAQGFVRLLQVYNGKSFCVPSGTAVAEVAKSVQSYTQSHQLSDRLTVPQFVQIMTQLYPCQVKNASGVQKETAK